MLIWWDWQSPPLCNSRLFGMPFSPRYNLCLQILVSLLLLHFVKCSADINSYSSHPRLIFSNRHDIRLLKYSLKNSRVRGHTSEVVGGLVHATGLDIHYDKGLVCWSDIDQEKIQCAHFDNENSRFNHSNPQITIVSDALLAPEDLVCDYVTSKIYWSDHEANRIEVVSIDKPYYRKVLIWDDLDQPRALALAPHLGWIFWSDWGEVPKIEKAGMDGSNRRTIVDNNIYWPNGIALDLDNQYLYWIDAKLKHVCRVDFDGGRRHLVTKGITGHPFALTFYAYHLYWSDWEARTVLYMRADGMDLKTISIHEKQKINPIDVVMLEKPRLPSPKWQSMYGNKNPCEVANCSHLCLLSPTTPYYVCTCPIGIKLVSNSERLCSANINTFLLVARGTDIRRISLDTDDFTDVVLPFTDIKHVLAVDYHVKSGFVFWTDDEAIGIRRAKLDGSEQKTVVSKEVVHPDGVAVDWVAENLYWTDTGTDRIEVARLDGQHRKILISRGLQEPRAIRVDPGRGLLFWSDWGKKAKIERSYLDGSERRILIKDDIFWPNGIALDLEKEQIYWSDAQADKIETAGYDGSNRRILVKEELPHVFGFTLVGDYIYWTDWQRRTLERANKITGKDRMPIKDPFSDTNGIVGININDKSLNTSNECSKNNGGCEHLCLYKPTGATCACASGYELTTDNKGCLIPDAFLVFSRDGDLHRISLNRTSSNNLDDVIPVSKVKAASALDFDATENRIYWSDTKMKTISRAYMNGSDTEKIIEFGLLHPEGLAVDWLSRNIYWSDFGRNRIEVAKLTGQHRRTILWNDIDSPRSLALHPAKGVLYFALWRVSNPSIEKSYLDGSRRSTFINGDIGRPNGLTIDLEESYLYWTDIDSSVIQRASLGNPHRKETIQRAKHKFEPFTLAQYQEYIYWSDLSTQSIRKAHKNGKDNNSPELLRTASGIVDMTIFHSLKQQGWNPCSQANCSHLCFSVPVDKREQYNTGTGSTQAKCGCPTHYVLDKDEYSCSPPSEFLLFSAGSTVSRLIFDTFECPDSIIIGGQPQKQRGIGALAWDSRERTIYWVDHKTSNIKRANEHGSGTSTFQDLVDENIKPFDIAFDEMRRLLFWTCESYNSINVSDASGNSLGSVLSSMALAKSENEPLRPRHLALYLKKSHLYFSSEDRIERIRLDGLERVIISQGSSSISGIAIDAGEEMLYWTDAGFSRIESSDLEGKNRKVIVSGLESPGSIAIMGRYVYWIEMRSGIERVDKWAGDERQRVLPRVENAKYLTYINTSISKIDDPCQSLRCSHVCIDGECSCFEGFVLSYEDQQTCTPRSPCVSHEFTCLRGRVGCVPLPLKCDGKVDCADGSDEEGCDPCEFVCPCEVGECFRTQCITKDQLCDSKKDCLISGWDESDEACAKAQTSPASAPISPITTTLLPIAILVVFVFVAVAWYLIRNKNTISSEESAEPLNHAGTNMVHLHTTDSRHFTSTNGSSVSSSQYCELLNPPPSPSSYYCRGRCTVQPGSYYMEAGPPPTPCSTICDNDNSDFYASYAPPPSPHTSSPQSTIRSMDRGANPPPPSPNLPDMHLVHNR